MGFFSFYLKWKENSDGMATSPFSPKGNGDGMATSPFYLKEDSDGMAPLHFT